MGSSLALIDDTINAADYYRSLTRPTGVPSPDDLLETIDNGEVWAVTGSAAYARSLFARQLAATVVGAGGSVVYYAPTERREAIAIDIIQQALNAPDFPTPPDGAPPAELRAKAAALDLTVVGAELAVGAHLPTDLKRALDVLVIEDADTISSQLMHVLGEPPMGPDPYMQLRRYARNRRCAVVFTLPGNAEHQWLRGADVHVSFNDAVDDQGLDDPMTVTERIEQAPYPARDMRVAAAGRPRRLRPIISI